MLPTSACVVLIRYGKIAAIRSRKHNGAIELPGGKSEPGEKPEETAIRECIEEVGVHPYLVRCLHVEEDDGHQCYVYLARIHEGDLESGPEGEAVWVTPEELLTGTYARISAKWLSTIKDELGQWQDPQVGD